jgi:hypothetical protein
MVTKSPVAGVANRVAMSREPKKAISIGSRQAKARVAKVAKMTKSGTLDASCCSADTCRQPGYPGYPGYPATRSFHSIRGTRGGRIEYMFTCLKGRGIDNIRQAGGCRRVVHASSLTPAHVTCRHCPQCRLRRPTPTHYAPPRTHATACQQAP